MNGSHIYFEHGTYDSERLAAEQKRRQQLRESSVELRELESKLRQAYINKELYAQLTEKEKAQKLKQLQVKEDAEYNEWMRLKAIKDEEEEEKQKVIRRQDLHRALDSQIREKRVSMYEFQTNADEERKAIDEIISQVKEENRRKHDFVEQKKASQRQAIESFMDSKRLWDERERERIKLEDEKIERYIEMKEALRQNYEASLNARRNLKTQYVFQLGEARALERQRDLDRENLRLEFHEGKLLELEKDLEDAEMANKIRRKLQLREAHATAVEYRRLQREREDREHRLWQAEMQKEAEKAIEMERLEIEKRRLQQIELWKDAKILMEDAKHRKELEMFEERRFWAEIEQEERERQKVIDSERRRMLREHSQRLDGFMPYEVISQEDKDVLAQENGARHFFK